MINRSLNPNIFFLIILVILSSYCPFLSKFLTHLLFDKSVLKLQERFT